MTQTPEDHAQSVLLASIERVINNTIGILHDVCAGEPADRERAEIALRDWEALKASTIMLWEQERQRLLLSQAKPDAESEKERLEKPVGYLYRQHYVVVRGGKALIYRYTAQGEGRARINEVEGMIPALRWIDTQRGKPTEASSSHDAGFRRGLLLQPEALDKLPDFIAADLNGRGNVYVIEHPTRGCYVGDDKKDLKIAPKFRWSIPRTHADVKVFMDRKTAEEKMAAMKLPKLGIVALTGR